MKHLAIASVIFSSAVAFAGFQIQPKVIYGNDDRQDVYEVSDSSVRELADSTVAMIANSRLSADGRGNVTISNKSYGKDNHLCKDEPFYDQPTAAMCSGFLVGDDMLATAGHCIQDRTCSQNSFVFNYKMAGPGVIPSSVGEEDVYKCAKVIAREQLSNGQDYSLVKLDRPVKGHKPLTLATATPKVGDGLFVIGHPTGLPTKVAGGAKIRRVESSFIVANLDTYGGNSGSAVFSEDTHEVVGILVRGERDFTTSGSCNRSYTCTDSNCRGEDVTLISYISKSL